MCMPPCILRLRHAARNSAKIMRYGKPNNPWCIQCRESMRGLIQTSLASATAMTDAIFSDEGLEKCAELWLEKLRVN